METIMAAQWYDALVAFPGCDKNMPGTVMAMGRLNRPSIMVYGGTIRAGCANIRGTEEKLDVVQRFQAYGQKLAGAITEDERKDIIAKSCPGQGPAAGCIPPTPCPPSSSAWASRCRIHRARRPRPEKIDECVEPARPSAICWRLDLKPRDIVTRAELHQRHAADDRPRRIDQCRAPLHRHGPRLRHRPDHRRLAEGQRRDAAARPISGPAGNT